MHGRSVLIAGLCVGLTGCGDDVRASSGVHEALREFTLTLSVRKGDETAQPYMFAQDAIKIGSMPSAHVRLDDPSVEPLHAVVKRPRPNKAVLEPADGADVSVNGVPTRRPVELSEDDELLIGVYAVVVEDL